MNPRIPSTQINKAKGIVFLTTLLDLIGFSIIFPLFPSLLNYYLESPQADSSGIASKLLGCLQSLAEYAPNSLDTRFCMVVLFGGIVGSLYSILQFIFAPIWGQLSDQMGRRRLLLITLLGTCLSYVLWLMSDSLMLFLCARMIGGMMAGNLSIATAAMADLTTQENRGKGMALIGMAFSIGFIIGPVVGGLSSNIPPIVSLTRTAHVLYAPALIALGLSMINFIGAYFYFPETLPAEKRAKRLHISGHLLHLFSVDIPVIRKLCITYLVFLVAFSGMEFTLTFLCIERFGFTIKQNGYLFLYIGLMLIFVQGFLVRRLMPILGEVVISWIGLCSGVIAFGLLAYARSTFCLYCALFFFSLCGGYVIPAVSSLISRKAHASNQGRYLGNFRSSGALGRAIGPLMAASIYFYFGSAISYCVGSLITLCAVIYMIGIPELKAVPFQTVDTIKK